MVLMFEIGGRDNKSKTNRVLDYVLKVYLILEYVKVE